MNELNTYRLTYVSRSLLAGFSQETEHEVERILDASRRNNPHAGVTGALLFSVDCFAQSLEGSFTMVQEVFERIQRDPRHDNTVVLKAGSVAQREFADWSMAYAGRVADDRMRFDALTGNDSAAAGAAGADQVLSLLRGVVLRAAPANQP